MNRYICLIVVFFFYQSSAQALAAGKSDELIASAIALENTYQSDKALLIYNKLFGVNPKKYFEYNRRGEGLLSIHRYFLASMDFRKANDLDPTFHLAHRNLSMALFGLSEYNGAIKAATRAIFLCDQCAEYYYVRSLSLHARNRDDEASIDLNRAAELEPALKQEASFKDLALSIRPAGTGSSNSPPKTSSSAVIAAVQAPPAVSTPALSNLAAVPETRVALVIGNGAYANADRLDNPTRDAAAVARALREAGFKTVRLKSDLRYDELRTALRDFAADSEHADWAVVYYAGHGMEVSGTNYLLPVDAQLKTDRTIGSEAIPLEQVLTSIGGARKLRLVILDACRDNPLAQRMTRTFASRSSSSGLAQVELSDSGTMVAFAAKHGQQAADGVSGQANSPFAAALIDNIAKPGVDIRRMFGRVRDQVMTATRKQQEPYTYGSLGGDEFLFKP